MKDWPDFNDDGDLPPGIHQATLAEVIEHFGRDMTQRRYEGVSIFWIRRLAALEGEQATVGHWQIKRDGTKRGIVEVIAK